jgi:hypothetical protein
MSHVLVEYPQYRYGSHVSSGGHAVEVVADEDQEQDVAFGAQVVIRIFLLLVKKEMHGPYIIAFSVCVFAIVMMLAIVFAMSGLANLYAARYGGAHGFTQSVAPQFNDAGAMKLPTTSDLARIDESIYYYREALSTAIWIAMIVLAVVIVFFASIAYVQLKSTDTRRRG